MSLIPLMPFLLALLIFLFVYLIKFIDDKHHHISLILALINAVVFLVYIPFYKTFEKQNWFFYLFLGQGILTGVLLLVVGFIYIMKLTFFKKHYKSFLNSIKATKWNAYYVVDQKGKIKEMSEGVLEELGFKLEDVIGKNLFDVFNKSIRITNFDDVKTSNRSLQTYYDSYPKEVKKDQLDLHTMVFQNYKGNSVLFTMVEQPIFIMGIYKGRINIGEKQSDFNLVGIEKELVNTKNELESLRIKYITTMELTEEALYYIDLDEKYLWGSENFLKQTGLKTHSIAYEDFQKYIYPEDLNSYLGTLSSLTTKKESFKTKYRFLKDGKYIWASDKGKRIFEDKSSNIILGAFNIIHAEGYFKVGIDTIDNLKTEKELNFHLKTLLDQKKTFQLALFDLSNIPEINKKYGREVGNMLISEYIKKLKTSFMSDSSEIFRISGIVFAVSIVDPRKMELLRTGLKGNNEFLNLTLKYGVVSAEIEVLLGVSSSYTDSKDASELISFAEQALNMARHKDFKLNACYYSDLNG